MGETAAWPAGGGETGAVIRARDWSRTPLGPVERWPQSLRTAVDIMLGSPAPTSVMWGPEHLQLYNDAYVSIAQERHPAALGRPALETWADARGFLEPIFQGVMAGGPPVVVQDRRLLLRRADGGTEERAFTASFSAIPDDSGGVGGIFHPLQEITGTTRFLEALRESEDRLRLTIAAADLGIWDHDLRTDLFHLDARAQTLYGLPSVATVGELLDRVHPEDRVRLGGEFRAAMDPHVRGPVDTEYRVADVDGTVRWLRVQGRVYFKDDGAGEAPVRGLGTVQDVTEERRTRDALRAGEERLRLALDVAGLGTWTWDLATGTGDIDPRGAEIVGLKPGSLENVAEAQRASIHPDDLARVEADVTAGLASGEAFDLVYRTVHPDGSVHHVASRARALTDQVGRAVRLMGTNRDVTAEREAETALRESEAALRESEARYRTLFESIDEGFCVIEVLWDEHGRPVDYRFLETNPAFVSQTGLQDAVGRTIRELVPAHEARWFQIYGRVARTGESVRFESRAEALQRWYDVFAARIGEADAPRVAVLFRDISRQRRAQEERERLLGALRVERARLEEVIRRAPAFMVVLRGPDHVLELVNDAYQQLIGHRDVVGKPLFQAVPEARGQGFEELLDRVLATGEPFTGRGLPVRLARTPGAPEEERIIDLAYVPLTEADGTRSGIVVLGTDVTEQVHGRREIERARDRAERLQALTAALAGARTLDDVADVVVADMVVALGARTGALARRAPEDDALVLLRTIGFSEPVEAGVRRQPLDLQSPLAECYRTQAPVWIERRDGPEGVDARFPPIAPVWDALGVASAAFVPLSAAGDVVGVISFAWEAPRVFTPEERAFLLALGQQAALAVERARLFAAEHAARAEAERANRAKSEFLAVMSHELRTPLNAIGGYAELMEMGIRGPITAQQRDDLHRIQQSQRHLLGLINEVLNYARLETGTVHYDLADVRMRDVIAGAEALVAPQAQAKALALTVVPCPPDLSVRADAEKVRQILVNLLSNAVKFTDRGGRVELACVGDGERVQVLVRDTGIGIPADQLDRIFEPFVQVRADLTRTAEGTGLGLAISRDLARGMGGDLAVESTLGAGSTFTLTLPKA
ncbi:MAG TPA: PAS domain-containing protein [Longimicrobium sp.]|nr:PAS domain-containing protein [Longimicrobium sp.]